jgi:hypothetical protein
MPVLSLQKENQVSPPYLTKVKLHFGIITFSERTLDIQGSKLNRSMCFPAAINSYFIWNFFLFAPNIILGVVL